MTAHIICILKVFYSLTNQICNYGHALKQKSFIVSQTRQWAHLPSVIVPTITSFTKWLISLAVTQFLPSRSQRRNLGSTKWTFPSFSLSSRHSPRSSFPQGPLGWASSCSHATADWRGSLLLTESNVRVCHVTLQNVSHHFPVLCAR